MNNFGPSVKAVRKASTHLTEEPYFTLNDVTYEQVEPKAKKEKNGKKKAGETEHSGPTAEGW